MYSTTTIIVGIPLSMELHNHMAKLEKEDSDEWREFEVIGFQTIYHGGSSYTPGYCGVEIGDFDECCDQIQLKDMALHIVEHDGETRQVPLQPTPKQITEAKTKVDAVEQKYRDLCPEFGVYFINGTN